MPRDALKFDTLIIGSGMAGFAAAVTLSQRQARVAILSRSVGASSVSSGCWDFGPVPNGPNSLENLRNTPSWQKVYGSLLIERNDMGSHKQMIECANEVSKCLDPYVPVSFAFENAFCLPTTAGRWKRTFGAQEIQARANVNLLGGKKVVLAGGKHWRFQTSAIAGKLSEESRAMGQNVEIVPFSIEDGSGKDCPIPHVAVRLECDEKYRSQFITAIHHSIPKGTAVLLFPPIFINLELAQSIQTSLGVRVAECLATTEPTAGQRLHLGMMAAMRKLDFPVHQVTQIKFTAHRKHIESIYACVQPSGEWVEMKAEKYILATGKMFGGGIHFGYRELRETVFNLPLFFERRSQAIVSRSELPWTDREFFEDQYWAKIGLWLDSNWRPMDNTRSAVYENLLACGSIIGGIDFAAGNVGLGFMSYSGRQCALAS